MSYSPAVTKEGRPSFYPIIETHVEEGKGSPLLPRSAIYSPYKPVNQVLVVWLREIESLASSGSSDDIARLNRLADRTIAHSSSKASLEEDLNLVREKCRARTYDPTLPSAVKNILSQIRPDSVSPYEGV